MTISFPKSSHPSGLHFFTRNPHPKKEDHGDCGVRALTLATGTDYSRVKFYADKWIQENDYEYSEPCWGYRTRYKTSYGGMTAGDMTSVIYQIARSYNTKLRNWYHHSLRTTFHLDNLPSVCIVEQCQHFVCVKDGAIYDSWDSRGKTKKLKEVKSVWCSDDVWNNFMTKHNGDLRAAGVVK
jgi:hypothetical protein